MADGESSKLSLPLSEADLASINDQLSSLDPQRILKWGLAKLPGLYQTTAFGLTGLAGTDMLSKLTDAPPDLIFLDTLYHFQETLDLMRDVQRKYGLHVHVYQPYGASDASEFEERYGERLWETNEQLYDYFAKVEPAQRAYKELGVKSVITGRRASQGGDRSSLKPVEVDSTGLVKLNPFFAWSFKEVKAYIDENNVPKNALLSQGYKSVGDWHSTKQSIGDGDEGERAGRWAGKQKSECGLHVDYFALKRAALKQQREAELKARDDARDAEEAGKSVNGAQDSNGESTSTLGGQDPSQSMEVDA